jgi:hypothetical protein
VNVFDHLNSKRGGSLLAVYSAIFVIAVLLFLSVWIIIHDEGAKDLPEHICYLFGVIILAAFGAGVASHKIDQTAPPEPPQFQPPPADGQM